VLGALSIGIAVAIARTDDGASGAPRPTGAHDGSTTTTTSTTVAPARDEAQPAAVTRSGRGDAELPISRPDGDRRPTILYATHQGAAFRVTAGATVLVDAAGPYEGYTLISAGSSDTLHIHADGPWRIEYRPTRLAKTWDGAAQLGRGDQVLRYTGPARDLHLEYTGQGSFAVRSSAIDGGAPHPITMAVGPYQGTFRLGAGPVLLAIQANNAVWGATTAA
jgi:hypothetical protein